MKAEHKAIMQELKAAAKRKALESFDQMLGSELKDPLGILGSSSEEDGKKPQGAIYRSYIVP